MKIQILHNNQWSLLIKILVNDYPELSDLQFVNLGNNEFQKLPLVLGCFPHIETLHIFNNQLEELNGEVIIRLFKCQLLNANNNQIAAIPPEVSLLM